MEPYPFHYSRRPRMEEFGGSSLKSMIDELQSMVARLGERIEDRCSGLENRVESAEHRVEERLISLEMARVESKAGHADMEKRFDGPEVGGALHQ
jgi:hypothetical protein